MTTRPVHVSPTARLLISIACACLPGCASYYARPILESAQASSFIDHQEREGLHVAVVDLSDDRTTTRYFDRHLPDYDVIPVHLLVELDSSATASFSLRREDLHLVLQDGTRLEALDPFEVIEKVSFSHWRSFFGFLFVLPGPFVVSSVNSANEELEIDYLQKSLRSVRLSRNMRSYQGVVFFHVPESLSGDLQLADAFVEVVAFREGEDGTLGRRLEFPVHFTR